jgi:hypothetical protein
LFTVYIIVVCTHACALSAAGALEAMFALGWVHDEANAEELVVREGTYFSMKEVICAAGVVLTCYCASIIVHFGAACAASCLYHSSSCQHVDGDIFSSADPVG